MASVFFIALCIEPWMLLQSPVPAAPILDDTVEAGLAVGHLGCRLLVKCVTLNQSLNSAGL